MENIKAMAWKFLTENNLGELGFNLLKLNNNMHFTIVPYSLGKECMGLLKLDEYSKTVDGFSTIFKNQKMIFYNESLSFSERNLVIAHEIGHIVLGHISESKVLGRINDKEIENRQKMEANVFALALIAPSPVLAQMKISSPKEISRITKLSEEFSIKALPEVMKEYNNINENSIEIELLEVYRNDIKKYLRLNLQKKNKKITISTIAIFCLASIVIFTILSENSEKLYTVKENTSTALTVFATENGAKYHLKDCRYVKNKTNIISMTLAEATEKNLVPCKVCQPN